MNNGMLNTAVHAAHVAGKILLQKFGRVEISDDRKNPDDVDPKTEAMRELKHYIKERYPTHKFANESGIFMAAAATEEETDENAVKLDEYVWILDPCAGYDNYIRGIPEFAVSMALKINGRTELACVYDPIRNEVYQGFRGSAVKFEDRRARVSQQKHIAESMIGVAMPKRKRNLAGTVAKVIEATVAECRDVRSSGVPSLDFAWVACGRLDGAVLPCLLPVQFEAGAFLVREAGGIVTDFKGGTDHAVEGNIICGSSGVVRELFAITKNAE